MIVIDCQIWVVSDLDVGDLIVVDVLLVDLFADDEQAHEVFLFDHYFHLVEDKLEFLAPVHRAVGLDLDLLQNWGCL